MRGALPLPNWLKKKKKQDGLVGIGLNPGSICLIRVERDSEQRPIVSAWDQHALADPADVDNILKQLAEQYDLKNSRCTTYLNRGDYWLLVAEAPDVPPNELKAAMRWRIKDLIDLPIDDVVLDLFEIPGNGTAGRARSMHAVAARNESVKKRAEMMQDAGIGLEVIDIPEMTQRNLAALFPQDESGIAMLSLDEHSGLITFTRNGEIYLTRNLDIGFSTLRNTSDPNTYYDRIFLEIQRSLDYYDSHFRQAPIRTLVLTPLDPEFSNLAEYLNQQLDLEAITMDLDQVLHWKIDRPKEISATCLSTLGAALRLEEGVL